MLTIEQIRAARALLDWSQSDLAEHADLSQTGIARIENGTNQPNTKTLEKIMAAFDRADIEFIGDSGLRKRTGKIRTLRGQNGFRTFMDEVYEETKKHGGDTCLFNGVPTYFHKWLGKDWYNKHSERMQQIGIDFNVKIVVEEGEHLFIGSNFAEYRWFPKDLFHEQTIYAYGNSLAFLSFNDNDVKIRILTQSEFADSFRILFNIAWDNVAIKTSELKRETA